MIIKISFLLNPYIIQFKKNIDGFSCYSTFKLVRLNIDFIFFESRFFMCDTIKTPILSFFKRWLSFDSRPVGAREVGGTAPLGFSRSVNPTIRGRGSDYAHLIKYYLPSRIFRPSYGPDTRAQKKHAQASGSKLQKVKRTGNKI